MRNQYRKGKTFITSASLSKEFSEIMDKYGFSPTDVMRRGIAVMLCEMGINTYTNDFNIKRNILSKEVLERIEAVEKLRKIKEILE